MKADLTRMAAYGLGLMLITPMAGYSQAVPPGTIVQVAQAEQASAYSPQMLDQLLAPIALYPDPLLSNVLMASTYPLEVVDAARWRQSRGNARLQGDQLDAALQQQSWDPSVKSLVPFSQVIEMMNVKLDWTESVGNAFLAQQSDVMDSVQRLRAQAQAAGTLRSTSQEIITTSGQAIMIEPANPQVAYVPYYNPNTVYGSWGYPEYPPVYFPPPYGYVATPGLYFGAGVGIIGVFWAWDSWDWNHHSLHVDADRYNEINNHAITHNNSPRYSGSTWQHDPSHRHGVPYHDPVIREKFQRTSAGASSSRHDFRGYTNPQAPQQAPPGPPAIKTPQANLPSTNPTIAERPTPTPHAAAASRGVFVPPPAAARTVAPAFSSFGRGPEVKAQAQRGQSSRAVMTPRAPTPAPSRQQSAPPQQHASPPARNPPREVSHDQKRH